MEWISVKEKLPPNDTRVIIWYKERHPNGKITETFQEVEFNSAYFEENGNKFIEYLPHRSNDYTDFVTHWFIVEPPKKLRNNESK